MGFWYEGAGWIYSTVWIYSGLCHSQINQLVNLFIAGLTSQLKLITC